MNTAQITNPPKPEHSLAEWKHRLSVDNWVTVTSCSDKQMWYAHEVGSSFMIHKADQDGLWTREPAGYSNFIKFEDAEF